MRGICLKRCYLAKCIDITMSIVGKNKKDFPFGLDLLILINNLCRFLISKRYHLKNSLQTSYIKQMRLV